MPEKAAQNHRRLLAVAIGLICTLSVALGYMLWRPAPPPAAKDGKAIEVYDVQLIKDGKAAAIEPKKGDDAGIDEAILAQYQTSQTIRNLSRGKIFYSMPLRDSASVKVYLHTAESDGDGTSGGKSRINAMLNLERRGGAWLVAREETIHVE